MKFITTLLACIVSGSVCGQTLVKEMNGADTRFIPGQYMKNGQAAIYFSTDEYGYSDDGQSNTEARIFDFELNPLKTFNFRILHPYKVYERRVSNGNIKKTKVITENRNDISGLPPVSDMEARKTAFVNWYFDTQKFLDPSLSLDKLIANSRIEGNKVFIKLNIDPNRYYGDYSFQEYLTSLETFFDASDQWGFSYTYSIEVPRCNGEWTTTTWYDVPVINFCTPKCVDVASVNYWNGGLYLPFSQTFFNDDEKFEYVRFNAEVAEGAGAPAQSVDGSVDAAEYLFGITANDRDGDGEEDYRVTVYGIRYSGLEVVSEDGDVIYSFPIPDNCEDRASIQFFKSDNSILAQADFNWYNEDNKRIHTTRFYRIDKSSRVAEVIRDEHRVSATPNPANRGIPVEMTIPIGSGQPRTVRVTAMNGEQIFSIQVAPDATKVSVPTANLSPGLYLLTLTENGHTLQTCKIIIR